MDSPAAVPSRWTAPFRKTSTESNEYWPVGGSSTENLAGSSSSLNRHSGGGIAQLFSSLAGSNSSLQSDKAEACDDGRTVSSRCVSTDRPIDINIHDIIEETNIEILRDKFEGEGAGVGSRRHHTFSSAASSPSRAEAGHARSASGPERLKTSQGRKGFGAAIMSSFRSKRDKSPVRPDRK